MEVSIQVRLMIRSAGLAIAAALISAAAMDTSQSAWGGQSHSIAPPAVAAASAAVLADHNPLLVPIRLADLPFIGDPECGTCDDDCNYQGQPGHIAEENPEGSHEKGLGWHSSCLAGKCPGNHNLSCDCWCQNDPDPETCMENCIEMGPGGEELLATGSDLQEIWMSVRAGQRGARAVADIYANVEFNQARGAIQVFGCDRRVIAHLPVPRGALGAPATTNPGG